jgi:hypothetical protein
MPRLAFEGLEPYDGNLSRTVLRGLGGSNALRLPGLDIRLNGKSYRNPMVSAKGDFRCIEND